MQKGLEETWHRTSPTSFQAHTRDMEFYRERISKTNPKFFRPRSLFRGLPRGISLAKHLFRGGTNRFFGKPCFCPLPKRGRFDENDENDGFAFYPLSTRASLLRPPKTTKMTKMAGVTQAKAWFRKSQVCSSLTCFSWI